MTILTNIKNEIIIAKTINDKQEEVIEQDVGIIDVDYSLIRYLGNQLSLKEITLNNWGYPIIKQDNTATTLYRLILEYYSKYNEKLKKILVNKKYEINHINKDKLDNRIKNLEIVTHQNNVRHSKGLEYETVMTSQQLQKAQEESLKNKQQNIDKEYLNRISGLFYKSMKTNIIDEKVLKCCYFKLKYIPSDISISSSNYMDYNELDKLCLSKILPQFYTNSIKSLLLHYKQYIYRVIVKNNVNLLNKYIDKYPNIKEILKKYKLMDKSNPKNPYNNILLNFYKYAYNSNKYTINNGNILLVLSIKNNFKVKGKYKAFIMLYLLGILQRQKYITKIKKSNNRKYVPIPSFIWIVPLRDEDFKQINNNAKELLKLNWNSVRYFMVAETFGEDTANLVYSNNKKCKVNYKYSLMAKEDIINYLKKDEAVKINGFITRNMIFHYVKELNAYRKQNGANYNKIFDRFYSFISSLLLYNMEVKEVLEQQELIYTTLNTRIIKNIEEYQKQNGITNLEHNLKPNMKVIILKNLVD